MHPSNLIQIMRIILSLLTVLVLIISFFALPARFRKRIQRFIDNAIFQSIPKKLLFLVAAAGLAFGVLILSMFIIHGSLNININDWLIAFVNHGSSFSIEAMSSSEKIWAVILGVFGIFFMTGMLISLVGNTIERRVEKIKSGKAYYYYKNHIVIIGYDRMGIGLIRQFAKDKRYCNCEIVIQTTQDAPKVRHELFSRLDSTIEKKITIISGNRTTIEDLERLQIDSCKEVFILGESDEYDNDSLDIECIKKIHHILSKKSTGRIIRCNVLFEYQSSFALFQRRDIDHLKDRIDFVPFNYYELWAQKVFVEGNYESPEKSELSGKIEYLPLDREGIHAGSDKKVHLVVMGMSRMGVALGVQAAHLCHFPNYVTKGTKSRITFIDENADVEMNFLMGRYRHLFDEVDVYYRELNRNDMMNTGIMADEAVRISPRSAKKTFTDIEFEFIKARVEYPAIQDYLAALSCNKNIYLTLAVCFNFPPKAIAAGLYLPDEIYDNNVQILIRQEIPYFTLDVLTKEGKYRNVKPFGMLENCYDLYKADDRIPMMVNYVYSKGIPEQFPEKELITMWRGLRTALKWSNRYHADSIKVKVRSFGIDDKVEKFDAEQMELMSRVEHNRWNMEKLLMGYRATTLSEKEEIAKDLTKKSKFKIHHFAHHDICLYDDLQIDENGVCAKEYDRRIMASLPLIIRSDERLREYVQGNIM